MEQRLLPGFAKNLRNAMFDRIQTYSFANIDHFSTAGLVTRLTTDVTNVQNAYQMMLRMMMRAPASMVCAMVMAFAINARLASIYLVAVLDSWNYFVFYYPSCNCIFPAGISKI